MANLLVQRGFSFVAVLHDGYESLRSLCSICSCSPAKVNFHVESQDQSGMSELISVHRCAMIHQSKIID